MIQRHATDNDLARGKILHGDRHLQRNAGCDLNLGVLRESARGDLANAQTIQRSLGRKVLLFCGCGIRLVGWKHDLLTVGLIRQELIILTGLESSLEIREGQRLPVESLLVIFQSLAFRVSNVSKFSGQLDDGG